MMKSNALDQNGCGVADVAGSSYKEIAAIINTNQGTVSSRFNR